MGLLGKLFGKKPGDIAGEPGSTSKADASAATSKPSAVATMSESGLSPATVQKLLDQLPQLREVVGTTPGSLEDFWQCFMTLPTMYFIARGAHEALQTGGSPTPFCTTEEQGPTVHLFASSKDALAYAQERNLESNGGIGILEMPTPAAMQYLRSLRAAGVVMAAASGPSARARSPHFEIDRIDDFLEYYREDIAFPEFTPEQRIGSLLTVKGVRRDITNLSRAIGGMVFSKPKWLMVAMHDGQPLRLPIGTSTYQMLFETPESVAQLQAALNKDVATPIQLPEPRVLSLEECLHGSTSGLFGSCRFILFRTAQGDVFVPVNQLVYVYRELIGA